MIAGTTLLMPEHALPKDAKLIQDQALIFTYLADWLKPLFQISVVFALFGTVYAGFEAAARMLYETGKNIYKKINYLEYRCFLFYIFLYLLLTGIPIAILMYKGLSVLLMLSLTLMFIGVIGVIMYGIGVVYLSQKILPPQYRLGKIGIILAWIAIFLMLIPFIFLIT